MRLAELTTLRVGGPAAEYAEVADPDELCDLIRSADASGTALLLVGGGSNLVVSDDGFPGLVLAVRTSGRQASTSGADVLVEVAAGEIWDDIVSWAVEQGYGGVETLTGIPGRVGATLIQNVGAYGTELADVLDSVLVLDRASGGRERLTAADCGLAYRTSRFKGDPDRFAILELTLRLTADGLSRPLTYPELVNRLSATIDARIPAHAVVEAVRRLRAEKAMLLDPADYDTWSAGSFFTNPFVAGPDRIPPGVAAWPMPDGRVKVSAAALIEAAGFGRGYGLGEREAAISTRHSLAITNRGRARTSDVIALARELRDAVQEQFAIELLPEPTLVGVEL